MPSVSLSPQAKMQFNQGGVPLAGGKLFTYAAGTAATKLATYTDHTGGTPNTNPIVLDANGQCDLWLADGYAYKLVLCPSTDTDPPTNPYWSEDYVSNNILPLSPTFSSLTVIGNATVGGTMGITGNTTVGGTFGVTGNATFSGTINKITITQPDTGATLTIIDGKVATISNTLTFTGTDGSSVALGTGGTVAYTSNKLSVFAATTSAELAGVISDETGTGKLVFATDPTFTLTDLTTNNASASQHGWCPKLSGSSSQFLNGTGVFSTITPSLARSARTSNTILATTDNASYVDITSGTFSQTFTAAATLGAGWYLFLRNSGTGDITLDPNGAELIDGLATYIMYPGECRLIQCDATGFNTIVVTPFQREFSASGTFTKPPGYQSFDCELWGAGGGGGSGAKGGSANGGAGGGGGAYKRARILASSVGTTETVTIGAGGAGGVAVSVNSTTGNFGIAGGNSSLGTLLVSYGGGGGVEGKNGGGTGGGGGGGGSLGAGSSGGSSGGVPSDGSGTTTAFGGGSGAAGAVGGASSYGGAGGGGYNTTGVAFAGGCSSYGGAGGGAGAGNSGADANGAAGGSNAGTTGGGGAGGVASTSTAPPAQTTFGVGGGGGYYRNTATKGTTAGASAGPTGGGGGGGAGLDSTFDSGAGGIGGRGHFRISGVA